jgi:hypothetical protein
MSYEEIDKSVYGTDVFTNGVNSRYAKPKLQSTNDASETAVKTGEKKKRSSKVSASAVGDSAEQLHENGYTDEAVKTKKKSRKTNEDGATLNEDETSQAASTVDGDTAAKTKKKRTPKVESNNENIDPVPIPTTEEVPVKKKKSKTPKTTSVEGDVQIIDGSTLNEPEAAPKVKKPKKSKTPKATTDDPEQNDNYEYATTSGIYLFIYKFFIVKYVHREFVELIEYLLA